MKAALGLILSSLLAPPASHADLGRLFYTPSQRAGLEQARLQNRTLTVQIASIPPKPVTYDGVVIRSDGHSTRWINGKPQAGESYELNARGKTLKPGQTLDQGQVYEAHGIRRTEMKETP
jgi:hypothetical protein